MARFNSHTKHNLIAALIMIVFIFVLASISYLQLLTGPIDKNEVTYQQVRIKPGATSGQIANLFAKRGLVRHPFLFKALVRFRGVENKLQKGYYRFNTGMSIDQMIDKLINGEVITYQFTIPEGFTVEQIARRIAAKSNIINRKDFLKAARNFEVDDFFILNELSELSWNKRKYSIEGYLFPETYRVPRGMKARKIIEEMLQRFKNKLSVNLIAQIHKSDYTLDEIITIASLIEAEAKYNQERKLIASVIYNRLEKEMALQIDATIQYILPKRKEKILYSDLDLRSFYNTYQNSGLPPGPINNPGLASIKAALNPAQTDYLYYFVLDNGSHKFSETYKQHIRLQNELKY